MIGGGRSYLRRLVDRGLGRAEVLQPLRPSRFEPALPGATTPLTSLFADVEAPGGVAAPARAGAPARRDPDPGDGPARQDAPLTAPPAGLSLDTPLAERAQPPALEPVLPARPSLGTARDDRSPTVERGHHSESHPAPRPDARPGPPPATARTPTRAADPPLPPARPPRLAPELPVARPSIQPPAVLRAPPPLPISSRASDRRAAAQAGHAAERPPAIHVTIGRVEVSTLPAPAPTARPASRRGDPAVPLDEYLRRRDQGRP